MTIAISYKQEIESKKFVDLFKEFDCKLNELYKVFTLHYHLLFIMNNDKLVAVYYPH